MLGVRGPARPGVRSTPARHEHGVFARVPKSEGTMASSKTVRARKRKKISGAYDQGWYAQLPWRVLRSKEIRYLQRHYPLCVVLLVQLLELYNGSNNGDLAIAMLRDRWRSSATLYRCVSQLVNLGWIKQTRPGYWGHKNKPVLYALTWLPIDECDGKLELVDSTTKPSDDWKDFNGVAVDGYIPVDIYIGVHLENQGNGASSSLGEPGSSSLSELGLVHQENKRIFTSEERREVDNARQ